MFVIRTYVTVEGQRAFTLEYDAGPDDSIRLVRLLRDLDESTPRELQQAWLEMSLRLARLRQLEANEAERRQKQWLAESFDPMI
jgi:hypothetical protein